MPTGRVSVLNSSLPLVFGCWVCGDLVGANRYHIAKKVVKIAAKPATGMKNLGLLKNDATTSRLKFIATLVKQ